MNSKRQTVWLVSMLGLMVVLSAYYLFTDEAEQIPGVETAETETGGENEIIVEGVGMLNPGETLDQLGTEPEKSEDESSSGGGAIAGDGTGDGTGDGAESGTSGDVSDDADAAEDQPTGTAQVSDQEVLDKMASLSGADAITAMQIERDVNFSRQFEALTAAIADESATEEEIAEAVNKHSDLMDLEARLIAFEEKLLTDYANAAVIYDEQKDHYTVHVSAPELERSEAVSIITEAVNDLAASIHQITVKVHR